MKVETVENIKNFDKVKTKILDEQHKFDLDRIKARPMSASTIQYKECFIPSSPISVSVHKKCWDESPEKIFDKSVQKKSLD